VSAATWPSAQDWRRRCITSYQHPPAAHLGAVADEDARAVPSAHVPQAHGAVRGPGRDVLAVGVPPHHVHVCRVACALVTCCFSTDPPRTYFVLIMTAIGIKYRSLDDVEQQSQPIEIIARFCA